MNTATFSYATQSGTYTKIGRLVPLTGVIHLRPQAVQDANRAEPAKGARFWAQLLAAIIRYFKP